MKEKNRHSQPFIMVLIVTIILLFASLINTKINLFGFETKKADLLSDIQLIKKEIKDTLPVLIAKDSIVSKDSINSIAISQEVS